MITHLPRCGLPGKGSAARLRLPRTMLSELAPLSAALDKSSATLAPPFASPSWGAGTGFSAGAQDDSDGAESGASPLAPQWCNRASPGSPEQGVFPESPGSHAQAASVSSDRLSVLPVQQPSATPPHCSPAGSEPPQATGLPAHRAPLGVRPPPGSPRGLSGRLKLRRALIVGPTGSAAWPLSSAGCVGALPAASAGAASAAMARLPPKDMHRPLATACTSSRQTACGPNISFVTFTTNHHDNILTSAKSCQGCSKSLEGNETHNTLQGQGHMPGVRG